MILSVTVLVPAGNKYAPKMWSAPVVPDGTYKELEVSIDKLEVGNPAEDPLIAQYPELSDASVLVKGTVDGTPYSFAAPLDVDLELLFDAPIEFTGEQDAVTLVPLTIDVSDWFAGTADLLDPNDPNNQSAIEGNIQASLDLLEND